MRSCSIAGVLLITLFLIGCLHTLPAGNGFSSFKPFTRQEMKTALDDLQQFLEQVQIDSAEDNNLTFTTIMPDSSTLVLDMRMDHYRSTHSGNSYTGYYRIETRLSEQQQIESHAIDLSVEIRPADVTLEVYARADAGAERLGLVRATVDGRTGDYAQMVDALLLQRQ